MRRSAYSRLFLEVEMITPKALKGAFLLGLRVRESTSQPYAFTALAEELLEETVTPLTVIGLEYLVKRCEQNMENSSPP